MPAQARTDGIYGPVPAGPPFLAGIVGSTAYGLGRPGSDIDRVGITPRRPERSCASSRPT